MAAHNEYLKDQIGRVIDQLEMASEDVGEDFAGALAHAEIALNQLREIVAAGHRAKAA